jgi:hypothetical protein
MDDTFGRMYGTDYRRTIFEYDERFERNVIGESGSGSLEVIPKIVEVAGGIMDKKFTIVTVDNGWGLSEFIRVAGKIDNSRRIVMGKGAVDFIRHESEEGFEFIPYDAGLEVLIREADVAFFPRVGAANKEDYLKLLKAGVAVVVRENCSQNAVQHEKNGWIFRDEQWAFNWLNFLRDHPDERRRVRDMASTVLPVSSTPLVTVITPTYRRDPKVIYRCLGCMILQTELRWEQLLCSDGEQEQHAMDLVKGFGDPRIRYTHTAQSKEEGDFGNTVRSLMLKQATGKYVLFFDDDNVILPNYLSEMVSRLENAPDCEFAVCKIMHFGPLNEAEVGKPPKVLTGDPVRLHHIDPLQVLVRREVMQKIGWDTTHGYISDGVTLEKLSPFKCVRVDQVLGVHM